MYRFTHERDMSMGVESPSIEVATDTNGVEELLRAFMGFLVACTFHPLGVEDTILMLAEEIEEMRDYEREQRGESVAEGPSPTTAQIRLITAICGEHTADGEDSPAGRTFGGSGQGDPRCGR